MRASGIQDDVSMGGTGKETAVELPNEAEASSKQDNADNDDTEMTSDPKTDRNEAATDDTEAECGSTRCLDYLRACAPNLPIRPRRLLPDSGQRFLKWHGNPELLIPRQQEGLLLHMWPDMEIFVKSQVKALFHDQNRPRDPTFCYIPTYTHQELSG